VVKVKTFVLDTNVLLHDPESIFKFQNNNLAIPVEVLEELDGIKGEQSTERGRNAPGAPDFAGAVARFALDARRREARKRRHTLDHHQSLSSRSLATVGLDGPFAGDFAGPVEEGQPHHRGGPFRAGAK
jgi:hypothetical protein